eukprot:1641872-Prymnesium_polylepis.1
MEPVRIHALRRCPGCREMEKSGQSVKRHRPPCRGSDICLHVRPRATRSRSLYGGRGVGFAVCTVLIGDAARVPFVGLTSTCAACGHMLPDGGCAPFLWDTREYQPSKWCHAHGHTNGRMCADTITNIGLMHNLRASWWHVPAAQPTYRPHTRHLRSGVWFERTRRTHPRA